MLESNLESNCQDDASLGEHFGVPVRQLHFNPTVCGNDESLGSLEESPKVPVMFRQKKRSDVGDSLALSL